MVPNKELVRGAPNPDRRGTGAGTVRDSLDKWGVEDYGAPVPKVYTCLRSLRPLSLPLGSSDLPGVPGEARGVEGGGLDPGRTPRRGSVALPTVPSPHTHSLVHTRRLIHTYTTCTCTHSWTDTYIYTYTLTLTYINTHVHLYSHTRTVTRTHTYTLTHPYIYSLTYTPTTCTRPPKESR